MRGTVSRPAGLQYGDDFIDRVEEKALLVYLSSLTLAPITIHGNTAKRTAGHFGLRYDYGSRVLRETDPIPSEFDELIRRAEEFAGLSSGAVGEALVNRYPPGASIGWHSDADVYKTIIGLSFGSSCAVQFRTKASEDRRVFEMQVVPRSIYVMTGPVQELWQHRIPGIAAERYSLTLRSLSAV
jgi:alkylated DNA repair dioxygenase AlkB